MNPSEIEWELLPFQIETVPCDDWTILRISCAMSSDREAVKERLSNLKRVAVLLREGSGELSHPSISVKHVG